MAKVAPAPSKNQSIPAQYNRQTTHPKPTGPTQTGLHSVLKHGPSKNRTQVPEVKRRSHGPTPAYRPFEGLMRKSKEKDVDYYYVGNRIVDTYRPVYRLFTIMGRNPTMLVRKSDGNYRYRYNPKSLRGMIFLGISILFGFFTLTSTAGFIAIFISEDLTKTRDRCGQSWEESMLQRNIVTIVVSYCWIFMTSFCGVVIALNYKAYCHYLNYWIRASQIMEMDVTRGAKVQVMKFNVEFITTVILGLVVFVFKLAPTVVDGSGSVVNMITRFFLADLGEVDIKFEEPDFCENRSTLYVEELVPTQYRVARCIGLALILYALCGAQTFIVQFKFHGLLLYNAARTWNQRYRNAVNRPIGDGKQLHGQYERRLVLKLLMKDQIIISTLFRLTGEIYHSILMIFYGAIVMSFCIELFYLSQAGSEDGCMYNYAQLNDPLVQECQSKEDPNKIIGEPVGSDQFFFRDPCDEGAMSPLPDALVALYLFIQTFYTFLTVTRIGSMAFEEAMHGFDIVRKGGFMTCTNRKERNLVHSLVISFCRCSPICISPSGYFALDRTLFVVIVGALGQYYVILLQFREGAIDLLDQCKEALEKAKNATKNI